MPIIFAAAGAGAMALESQRSTGRLSLTRVLLGAGLGYVVGRFLVPTATTTATATLETGGEPILQVPRGLQV